MSNKNMDWRRGLVSKLTKLTRPQTFSLAILTVVMLSAFWFSRSCFFPTSGSITQSDNTGGINIGSIDNIKGDVDISLGSPQQFKGVEFLPIPKLPLRLQQIKFDETEPTTMLRLISSRWDINHEVRATNSTTLSQLSKVISQQLSLDYYVTADVTNFPVPKGARWMPTMELKINGKSIAGREDMTIGDAKLNNGDLLQFELTWYFRVEMGTGNEPAEPTNRPPSGIVD